MKGLSKPGPLPAVFAALTPWVLLWATLWIAWQILAIATFAVAQARRVR